MLAPLALVMLILAFALPVVVTGRPITPLRFSLTIIAVLVGLFTAGHYWKLEGVIVYIFVVPVASVAWLAINRQRSS
jgi:hypothetical protein